MLWRLPSTYSIAHLTIDLGSDCIVTGRTALVESFAAMRRRTWWKSAVVAGRGTIEVRPSAGGTRAWHIHAHVLCVTTSSPPLSTMASTWTSLLGEKSLRGSLKWQHIPEEERFAIGKDGRNFSPIGMYVSKRRTEDEDGFRPWLDASDAQLREIALDVPGKRLGLSFGKVPGE